MPLRFSTILEPGRCELLLHRSLLGVFSTCLSSGRCGCVLAGAQQTNHIESSIALVKPHELPPEWSPNIEDTQIAIWKLQGESVMRQGLQTDWMCFTTTSTRTKTHGLSPTKTTLYQNMGTECTSRSADVDSEAN